MSKVGYHLSDLTPGERLWIARRQQGLTRDDARHLYEASRWVYERWEQDIAGTTDPPPYVHLQPLTPADKVALARRRAGLSVKQFCGLVGLSHVSVIKWERHATTGANPLLQYWETVGWPRPAR